MISRNVQILYCVHRLGGEAFAGDVAAELTKSLERPYRSQTVAGILERLRQTGALNKTILRQWVAGQPINKRRVLYKLTEHGRELLTRALASGQLHDWRAQAMRTRARNRQTEALWGGAGRTLSILGMVRQLNRPVAVKDIALQINAAVGREYPVAAVATLMNRLVVLGALSRERKDHWPVAGQIRSNILVYSLTAKGEALWAAHTAQQRIVRTGTPARKGPRQKPGSSS